MSEHELNQDDAALKALLQQHAGRPPVDDVDWSALHARITTAAAPRLRAPRPAQWWQQVAGWSARGVPLAAAAAAVLAVLLGTGIAGSSHTRNAPAESSFLTLEEELASGAAVFLAGSDDTDAVIDALLFYNGEE